MQKMKIEPLNIALKNIKLQEFSEHPFKFYA